MTIATGFVCSDGVLLASDTLYSNTGMGNKYGPKFWILDHGDVLVVFGGAGTEGALLRTRDEIARKLRPGMSRIRVVDIVDWALARVAGKLPDDPAWKTSVLVAIRIQSEVILYENAGQSSMLSPVQHQCQCVGYAQSLGWYFASSLFRSGMSMKWAGIVAAHTIKKCKDYSEYCGGESHLVELPSSGVPRFIKQTEIASLEGYLSEVDQAMRLVLPDDRIQDEDTLLLRLHTISTATKEAAGSFMVPVGDGVAAIVSGLTDATDFKPQTTFRRVEGEAQVHPSPKRGQKGQPPSKE